MISTSWHSTKKYEDRLVTEVVFVYTFTLLVSILNMEEKEVGVATDLGLSEDVEAVTDEEIAEAEDTTE